jgi:uncharacterized protein YajQ (UPF0234 family)
MPSFDVVSKVQWNEVDNALQQAQKEVAQRYDFKDTETELEKTADGLVVKSTTEDRARAALTVLREKLIKRKVSMKCLDEQKPEKTSKGGARILTKIKEGIEAEAARKINQAIKDAKLKVQSSMQEAQVRVTGKNKDDLQKAIQLVRGLDLGVDTQFLGEAGHDGKGRVHAIVKWHEATKTAYVIGANPGARATPFSLEFPWTIAKAELLDWGQPAPGEDKKDQVVAPKFAASADVGVYDRTLFYTAPIDEGFILRITPLVK